VASLPQSMAMRLAWPGWLSRMDPSRRGFTLALIASLVFHAVLLSIHFKLPDRLSRATQETLEVVLVNAKSMRKPDKAQARAQANLDGGGNTDENRRAKTPLPPSRQERPGDSLMEAQRRVQELEIQQQALLTQAKSKKAIQAEARRSEEQQPELASVRGVDLAQSALAIARMEAQIARRVEDYNKRPRRKEITARTVEVSYAMYFKQWTEKIERVGSLNYPPAAKGRPYTLLLTVSIKEDGDVEKVEIDRPSGNKEVDQHALRIIDLAKPFGRFSPQMRAEYQVFDIVTTWTFTPAGALSADLKR
jgi:protein TonB